MSRYGQDRAGSTFGHYELRRLIGRGGMGEVYEAYDTRKDRTVALKLLPHDLAADEEYRRRFQREAQVAARLQEPHVVPIHDFGEIEGLLYIDMRLVQGVDLKERLAQDGPLPPGDALAIVRQVGEALDAAHGDGLVHRDVKPANVLVLPSGFAYLVDFGIATVGDESRMTTDGGAVGSLAYMSPERFKGESLTPACDIYALGCLLYELLTGRPPYRRDSFAAQMNAHLHEEPTPASALRPGLPREVDDVIARAMAKDPRQRHGSARAMTADLSWALGAAAAETDIPTRPRQPADPTGPAGGAATPFAVPGQPYGGSHVAPAVPPSPSRRRGGIALGVALLAVLVGAAGVAGVNALVDRDDEPRAAADGQQVGSAARRPGQTQAGTSTPVKEGNEYTSTSSTSSSSSEPSTTTSSTQAPPPSSSEPAPRPTTTTRPEATGGTSSAPPTTSDPPDIGPTLAPGPGYDWQGWSTRAARCNADDRALAVAAADGTQISICEVSLGGRTYYRAVRNGNAIELDDPVPSSGGWTATNKSYSYHVGPSSLVVTRYGKTLVDEPLSSYVTP